jgi:hypothetical protein
MQQAKGHAEKTFRDYYSIDKADGDCEDPQL